MNPAFSVIFLTTLIGAGQGLFLALFTVAELCRASACCRRRRATSTRMGSASRWCCWRLAWSASFFHLGRPERAWRVGHAVAHVVAVARGHRAAGLHGRGLAVRRAHAIGWHRCCDRCRRACRSTSASCWASLGTVLAFALFVCTGMIYACLRFLQRMGHAADAGQLHRCSAARRASRWPRRCAALGGAGAGRRFCRAGPSCSRWLARSGAALSLWRNARLKPKSTLQTAIGIKHPRIVQTVAGLHGRLVQHARVLPRRGAARAARGQVGFLVLAFVLPVVLLAPGRSAPSAAAGAGASSCSTSACWPSAGSSSRRPITRRTCTTRRCRDALHARRPVLAVAARWPPAAPAQRRPRRRRRRRGPGGCGRWRCSSPAS